MKKLIILFISYSGIIFAVVPTTDISQIAQDQSTMAQYSTQVSSTVSKIGAAMTAADQVQNLQGLQRLQAGTTICQLCNASDQAQLMAYSNSINNDLCSQFSNAYTNISGMKTSVTTLSQVMSLLSTNPKAALLALQQAGVMSTQAVNNTLGQMQIMQAQSIQKQLATEKIQNQSAQNLSEGLRNPGL